MSIKLVWRGGNSTDTRRIALASSNYNMLQDLVCEKFHVGIQDFTLRHYDVDGVEHSCGTSAELLSLQENARVAGRILKLWVISPVPMTHKDHIREPYRRLIGGSPENEVDKSEGYVPQVLKSAGNKTVDKYVPVSATSDLLTEITPSYIPKLLNKNATRPANKYVPTQVSAAPPVSSSTGPSYVPKVLNSAAKTNSARPYVPRISITEAAADEDAINHANKYVPTQVSAAPPVSSSTGPSYVPKVLNSAAKTNSARPYVPRISITEAAADEDAIKYIPTSVQ